MFRNLSPAFVSLTLLLTAAPSAFAQGWTTLFNGTSTAGLAVDRTNGDIYAVVEKKGIFKSVDQGKTFALANSTIVKSHAETGSGLSIDPEGGRLMCFMNYGDAGGTLDAGKTWFKSSQGNWDYGCVDWSDPKAMTFLGRTHGAQLQVSFDQTKSWKKVDGSHGLHLGIADASNLLVGGDKGIFLSTNQAATWQKVSDLKPKSHIMRIFKGVCYWLTDAGVIGSKDKGKTWLQVGAKVDACVGPFFGADDKSMMVVGLSGFSITHDHGETWKTVAKLPDSIKKGWDAPEGGDQRPYWFVQFGWDPKNNILYASSLSVPVQKYQLEAGD